MNNDEYRDTELSDQDLKLMMEKKFKKVYSQQLGRKVYVLTEWIDKPIFKKNKKLFGYCDIGWTVKHPKQLIRSLVREGIWSVDDQ